MNDLLRKLGISLPIIQAPMAGVSTPAMAAAVSNAGGLGSIGIGAADVATAESMIRQTRELTHRPFNVNVFCHQPAVQNATKESAWIQRLAPLFARFQHQPPLQLREIYTSFIADDAMLAMLIANKPAVVSIHFGLPSKDQIQALQTAGILLLGSATNPLEALAVQVAGIDAVVAQGYEAGGHRGMFDPSGTDDCLGTLALTRLLVRELSIPVISAGGIMDGAGIAACLKLGASAAQLGTAFIDCPESSADAGFRAALKSDAASHTVMTRAISGRPARCLPNRFTALGNESADDDIPAYPIAYDAAKSLHAVAKSAGEFGYGAQWAGQGAPLARALPAGELVAVLKRELEQAMEVQVSNRT